MVRNKKAKHLQNVQKRQRSDFVPAPYGAIVADSNQHFPISTKNDIEIIIIGVIKMQLITISNFVMDLEREVCRTAVLHFGWERIAGLKEVGSET